MITRYGQGALTRDKIRELAIRNRDMDMLIQGTYGDFRTGKACSIGCMLDHGQNHNLAPEVLGISEQVAWLIDYFFESFDSIEEAANFHVEFYDTLRDGADTSLLHHKYLSLMLIDKECGAYGVSPDTDVMLRDCAELHRLASVGEVVDWSVERIYDGLLTEDNSSAAKCATASVRPATIAAKLASGRAKESASSYCNDYSLRTNNVGRDVAAAAQLALFMKLIAECE